MTPSPNTVLLLLSKAVLSKQDYILSETRFCMIKGSFFLLHNNSQECLCRRCFWFPYLLWEAGRQRLEEPAAAVSRSTRGTVKVSCSRCIDLEELLAGGLKPEMTIFGGFSTSLKAIQESMGPDKGWQKQRKGQNSEGKKQKSTPKNGCR